MEKDLKKLKCHERPSIKGLVHLPVDTHGSDFQDMEICGLHWPSLFCIHADFLGTAVVVFKLGLGNLLQMK